MKNKGIFYSIIFLFVTFLSLVGCSIIPEKYDIKVNDIENGVVTLDQTRAKKGEEITFTVEPNIGFEINKIYVEDEEKTYDENGCVTFTMPANDVNIEVSFNELFYNITLDTFENGKITILDNINAANYNDEITLLITPDEGCEFVALYINDEIKMITSNTYKFNMPAENVFIEAIFKNNNELTDKVKINYDNVDGLLFSNENKTLYDPMTTFQIKYTIEEGYELDYFTVNGTRINSDIISLEDVDVVISAVLIKLYKVTYVDSKGMDFIKDYEYYKSGTNVKVDHINKYIIEPTYVIGYFDATGVEIKNYVSHFNFCEFVMPSNDVEIRAILYSEKGYKVEHANVEGISWGDEEFYSIAGSYTVINYELEDGYVLDYFTVNGERIISDSINGFYMPENNVVVSAVLSKGYRVSLAGDARITFKQEYKYYKPGSTVYLPNYDLEEGYVIDYLIIDGTTIDPKTQTYEMPEKDVSLYVVTIKGKKVTFASNGGITFKQEYKYYKPGSHLIFRDNVDYRLEEGYVIDYFIIDGEIIDPQSQTYEIPEKDVSLYVVTTKGKKVSLSSNGGITFKQEYKYYKPGSTVSFTDNFDYQLEEGCEIDSVVILGENIALEFFYNHYYFTMLDKDVVVYFEIIRSYEVTYEKPYDGLTFDADMENYKSGDTVEINYTLAEGYKLNYFLVNGTKINGNTFEMPDEDVVVTAEVEISLYKITFNSVEGYTFDYPWIELIYGSKLTLSLDDVDEGYEVDYFTVDGERIEGNSFTVPAREVVISVVVKKVV